MPSGLSSFSFSPSLVSLRVGKRMLWLMPYQGDMLSFQSLKPLGFQSIKALYHKDKDFKEVVENPSNFCSFTLQDGFLFKENKLCIPKSPLRDLIVKKVHGGALTSHFSINKTLQILKDHFYWPNIGGDVHKVIPRCNICHIAKSHFH